MNQLEWISGQVGEMIHLTETWASINSHAYNVGGLLALQGELIRAFSPHVDTLEVIPLTPIETFNETGQMRLQPLGNALSFKKGDPSRRNLLFVGHMDTVYPLDHPYQKVTATKDRLHGPGVADMKGGLAVLLTLVRALENSDIGFEVVITPDEEIGSPRSSAYFEQIAPLYKTALIFEPAMPDGALVSSRPGSVNYQIFCRGKAAHMGRDPSVGKSAILALSDLSLRLSALQNFRENRLVNIGTIKGGHAPNMVPDRCEISVNVRSDKNIEPIEQQIMQLAKEVEVRHEVKIEMRRQSLRPPKPVTQAQQGLIDTFTRLGKELNRSIAFRPTGGTCDGNNLFSLGLNNIDTLGPIGHHLHSAEEFLEISSFVPQAQLAYLFSKYFPLR